MARIYYVGALIDAASQEHLKSFFGMVSDHITIAYSRVWFPYEAKLMKYPITINPPYEFVRFSDLLVLAVRSKFLLDRHNELMAEGASWDFPSYIPHITLMRKTEPSALPDFPITLVTEYYGTWEE